MDAAIGKPVLRRVPSAQVEDTVARLFAGYLAKRQPGESFAQFCVRTPDASTDRAWERGRERETRRSGVTPSDRLEDQRISMEAHSEQNLMDELEAGEAAVELDDKEPQEVLAWAIEKFGRRLGICSSFQADGCVLIDMAWRIDPGVRVFTIDTGRQPEETYKSDRSRFARATASAPRSSCPTPRSSSRWSPSTATTFSIAT